MTGSVKRFLVPLLVLIILSTGVVLLGSNNPPQFLRRLALMVGLRQQITLESDIPGLDVEIVERKKLKQALDNIGFWTKGIPSDDEVGSLMVKPETIEIILTTKDQSRVRLQRTKDDVRASRVSSALGWEYQPKRNHLVLFYHYNPVYLSQFTNEKFANILTNDVLLYSSLLAGNKHGRMNFLEALKAAQSEVKRELNANESWLKTIYDQAEQ